MNPTLAAFHLVRDFPGGACSLAPLLGKSPATLSHEVNPTYTTAKLGLEDAVKLTLITGDLRIVSAFAVEANCLLVPMPAPDNTVNSMAALSAMARRFAELVATVTDASMDGRVTPNELRKVEKDAGELVASVQSTVRQLAARVQHADLERERVV